MLVLLAYLAGVLTILSPCILPIVPFVFARADQPFCKSGLPLLAGMSFTFALVAVAAGTGGSWLVRANEYGRLAALVLFVVLGVLLIVPAWADRVTRPFVALGNQLSRSSLSGAGASGAIVLGVATGLLWAPCAGPILGLILTGAAIRGATLQTWLLLFAYAAGAATSLAIALLAGQQVFALLKRFLKAERFLRPALGGARMITDKSVALGWDRGILTSLSTANTTGLEQKLLRQVPARQNVNVQPETAGKEDETEPSFEDATQWINSAPLQLAALRGKVVLVDFWTYSCINCLRTIPYVKAWAEKYKDSGLVVVGVHTPEFAFEKNISNVQKAVRDLDIKYPVAVDNDYDIWTSFDNDSWPGHYFLDIHGKVRHKHLGEGAEAQSERWIQELLSERPGQQSVSETKVKVQADGAHAAADSADIHSPETYLGYERARHFVSREPIVRDKENSYRFPPMLELNQWSLAGRWFVGAENIESKASGAAIRFRFHARDVHLVLGNIGKPHVRFEVTLDGRKPGKDHGVDTDKDGSGWIEGHRLYQLIRQKDPTEDHVFEIRFFDSGAQAFAFTFG